MTPSAAAASKGKRHKKWATATFRRWLLVAAAIPAVIVIGWPLWGVIFSNPPHEYHFDLWTTSSDFIVSGLIILIAGNIELQSARLSKIDTSSQSGSVAGWSLGIAVLGLVAYGYRYQAEEEAIRSKVDLSVDLTLMIACPLIFFLMAACGITAARLVLNSPTPE